MGACREKGEHLMGETALMLTLAGERMGECGR